MRIYASEYPIEDAIKPYVGKDVWIECRLRYVPGYMRVLSVHWGGPNFVFNFLPKSFIYGESHAVIQTRSGAKMSVSHAAIEVNFPLHILTSEELGLDISADRDRVMKFAGKDVWVSVQGSASPYFIKIIKIDGVVVYTELLSKSEINLIFNTSQALTPSDMDYYAERITTKAYGDVKHIDTIHFATPTEIYTSEELLAALDDHPVGQDENDNDDDEWEQLV